MKSSAGVLSPVPRASEKEVPAGKVALLNAAERLFAEHGFFGTAMRDITKLAGVPHGLATYHFKTKDDLFRAVVARRLPLIMGALDASLDEVLRSGLTGMARIEALLDAHIVAHLEFSSRGQGETDYLRMTQQMIALGKRRLLSSELAEAYSPIYARYRAAMIEALPEADAHDLELRFHLMRLCLAGVITDIDSPVALSLKDIAATRAMLRSFCAYGFLSRPE